jgi:hypothetical protein
MSGNLERCFITLMLLNRKPASRFEVVQLQKALDDMLEKAGVHEVIDLMTAPTQVSLFVTILLK